MVVALRLDASFRGCFVCLFNFHSCLVLVIFCFCVLRCCLRGGCGGLMCCAFGIGLVYGVGWVVITACTGCWFCLRFVGLFIVMFSLLVVLYYLFVACLIVGIVVCVLVV